MCVEANVSIQDVSEPRDSRNTLYLGTFQRGRRLPIRFKSIVVLVIYEIK